ncbi:MAG TPA: SymE family type I addiction module toxin [Verrucomicrobiae bacterium]|nr:SymE family type I addiction module toxin [Verrucomicrobiae bacterium]
MKIFLSNRRRLLGNSNRSSSRPLGDACGGDKTENEVPVLDSLTTHHRRAIRLPLPKPALFYVVVSGTKQRSLKCEKTGEFFYGKTVPLIRLRGKWLAAAGFPPNSRVQVKILRSGLIQLTKEKSK